jgi:hypothetical protein
MRQPTGIDRTIALGMLGAGALVGVAAPAASAATAGPETPRTTAQTYQASTYQTQVYQAPVYRAQWSRLGQIKLYPLAGTAVDPLSNTLGTNLGGLPVSTAPVSAVFADGLPVRDLPLLGGMLAPPAGSSTATDTDDDEARPAAAPAAP